MKLFSRSEFLKESLDSLFGYKTPSFQNIKNIYIEWKSSVSNTSFFDYLKDIFKDDINLIEDIRYKYESLNLGGVMNSNELCQFISDEWKKLSMSNESLDTIFDYEEVPSAFKLKELHKSQKFQGTQKGFYDYLKLKQRNV